MSVSSVTLDVAKRLDITCRKGDTFNLVVNVTDSAGAVVDLTTYSFKMTITGTSGGVLTVNIGASIMSNVSSGLYAYDLQTIKAGTTQTWLTGVLQVNEDVTI